MPKPFSLTIGPFTKGLNLRAQPELLEPEEATISTNADYLDGTIRVMSCLANSAVTGSTGAYKITAGSKAILVPEYRSVLPAEHWISNANEQWFLVDGLETQTTNVLVWYATFNPQTSAQKPTRNIGATQTWTLGLVAPSSAPGLADGIAGSINRRYRVTFVRNVNGYEEESNPSPISAQFNKAKQCVITIDASSDATVTARRIYATQNGDPDGPLYFLWEVSGNSATTFTDVGGAVNLFWPLNWDAGGSLLSASRSGSPYEYDHSPAPGVVTGSNALTHLSNAAHSVNDGAGGAGAGIYFGAVGDTVRWSALGYPGYWPLANSLRLPEAVKAIVSHSAQTFVFTASRIYAFTGVSDQSMASAVTQSHTGTKYGRTVARCPWGVLFLCDEGIGLFDGNSTSIVTKGIAKPGELTGNHAVFYQGRYLLMGGADSWVLDMRDFPAIRLTKVATGTLTASTVNVLNLLFGPPGVYVAKSTADGAFLLDLDNNEPFATKTGQNKPDWAGQAWTHKTGRITLGKPERRKRFTRFWLNGSGTVKFYVDGTLVHTASASGRLPPSCQGRYLEVEMTGSINPFNFSMQAISSLRIDGVLHDGA